MAAIAVLRKKEDFDTVFQFSQYKVFSQEFSLFAYSNALGYPRLGMIIAKKSIKLAVKRNMIKRRLRESFRLLIVKESAPLDCVIVVKREATLLGKKEVYLRAQRLFARLLEKSGASL